MFTRNCRTSGFRLNKIRNHIGVRDCPYRICCPWVRGGFDLDALGKFFRRRRRRRRRRRPLLFRQFLEQVVIFSHFHQKLTFCDIFFLNAVFSPRIFAEGMPARTLVLLFWRKYAYVIK